MMKKTILVAALALLAFDMSAKKKTEPKEEGFVFTTVIRARAGASPASASWRVNCCAWVKVLTTCPKCSLYITPW